MPAGYSDAALELGAAAMVNRSFVVELHTGDPGTATGTAITRANVANKVDHEHNGYYAQYLAQNTGVTAEGSSATEARYSNAADIDFGSANSDDDTNGWGNIQYATLWYDANAPGAADPGTSSPTAFDTLFAIFALATSQTVGNGDPFVIRSRTMDIVAQNI